MGGKSNNHRQARTYPAKTRIGPNQDWIRRIGLWQNWLAGRQQHGNDGHQPAGDDASGGNNNDNDDGGDYGSQSLKVPDGDISDKAICISAGGSDEHPDNKLRKVRRTRPLAVVIANPNDAVSTQHSTTPTEPSNEPLPVSPVTCCYITANIAIEYKLPDIDPRLLYPQLEAIITNSLRLAANWHQQNGLRPSGINTETRIPLDFWPFLGDYDTADEELPFDVTVSIINSGEFEDSLDGGDMNDDSVVGGNEDLGGNAASEYEVALAVPLQQDDVEDLSRE